MLQLIWTLINIGICFYFICICFKAAGYIKLNLGILPLVIFVLGLLCFISRSRYYDDRIDPSTQQIRKWKFAEDSLVDSKTIKEVEIPLEKTLLTTGVISITYGLDKKSNRVLPLKANYIVSGLIGGYHWYPSQVMVDTTATDKQLTYAVAATVEWQLLGTTIGSQSKEYKGLVALK